MWSVDVWQEEDWTAFCGADSAGWHLAVAGVGAAVVVLGLTARCATCGDTTAVTRRDNVGDAHTQWAGMVPTLLAGAAPQEEVIASCPDSNGALGCTSGCLVGVPKKSCGLSSCDADVPGKTCTDPAEEGTQPCIGAVCRRGRKGSAPAWLLSGWENRTLQLCTCVAGATHDFGMAVHICLVQGCRSGLLHCGACKVRGVRGGVPKASTGAGTGPGARVQTARLQGLADRVAGRRRMECES
mmetsp:Transcript_35981/g.80477  ORF Transcript_35981/g.80477 Transcript_35981/m.80477 type:complete len:241 (+) Transcript_35981:567-1289(+)